jgi:membrane-associated PAP2 superfamily phosphatase
MLTPCGPKAVPTGGAGLAFPAGHCNFTIAFIGFAIFYLTYLFGEKPDYTSVRT